MKTERRIVWVMRCALPLAALFTMAGGLGLSTAVALTGLFAAPLRAAFRTLSRPGPALLLSIAAIGWIAASYAWSPYDRPDQALKLVLLTPLFALVPLAASGLGPHARAHLRTLTVFCVTATLLFFLAEVINGAAVSTAFKLHVEGMDPDRPDLADFVMRVLSRGATPAIMLTGPVALMLWRGDSTVLRWSAVAILVLAAIASASFRVEANILAFAGGLVAGAAALFAPRRALQSLLVGLAALILMAPLIMVALLSLMSEPLRAQIPLSWEWRLEIWAHASTLIAERPLFGHGLDVARTIDETAMLRGMEIELMSLHAHNAALQIWLDAGAVGAALCAGALGAMAWAVGRRAPDTDVAAGVAYVVTVWVVSVMLGYGVWQEWHHGALALALAVALLLEGAGETARNLPRRA